jgi:hypothetical protein
LQNFLLRLESLDDGHRSEDLLSHQYMYCGETVLGLLRTSFL